jgi:hypothetical protein
VLALVLAVACLFRFQTWHKEGLSSKCQDKCESCAACERKAGAKSNKSKSKSKCKSKCKLCTACKAKGTKGSPPKGAKGSSKSAKGGRGSRGGGRRGEGSRGGGSQRGEDSRGRGGDSVKATYHMYDESGPLQAVTCQDNGPGQVFVAESLLRSHHWTAVNAGTFGIANGEDWATFTQQACGKCAHVTNPANGKSGKFVIVDRKGDEGLDLSPAAFNSLGLSVQDGHSYVRARIASC